MHRHDGIPNGYRKLTTAEVFVDASGKLVVTAAPAEVWPAADDLDAWETSEESPHNCDAMACGCHHVIARAKLESDEEPQP